MGVKGLWKLLLPIGRRISIETLEGQILAIDASIWLTQFLTVAARQREQDLDGSGGYSNRSSNRAYSYDYLVGFLRRLCKLRYQGVRPVLVFDGDTPEIKKREVRARRRKRKAGDAFYLGGGDNESEHDEAREAARRTAKRILARQLRTGRLSTTTKNRARTTVGDAAAGAKPGDENVSKSLAETAAAAKASYAPGFYDPDAPERPSDALSKDKNDHPGNDGGDDDDHLLRDNYHTNPLQEDVNDWDTPIVIDGEEDDDDSKNGKTHPPDDPPWVVSSHPSKFHAGDGTSFRVESVADLPESARKDVIEDARKQRRLASRREFMRVASDPDGLSSCQLRNFLKSTRLNRDIARMARAAKAKAEENAKMVLGNGILFEKDTEDGNRRRPTNHRARSGARHRYSGAASHSPGRMRVFHHQNHQTAKTKANGDEESDDDEHDFRKARNNHYLSNGIRFAGGDDEDEEEDEDETIEGYWDNETDASGSKHHHKITSTAAACPDETNGGFVVAVMDGSDGRRKTTVVGTTPKCNHEGGIIEIDSSSESDGNGSESEEEQRFTNPANHGGDESQERQDEALARALQTIEEEEMSLEESDPGSSKATARESGWRECLRFDNNDGDRGFLRTLPASENKNEWDQLAQQEGEDAKMARALQEAEYDEGERSAGDGGGGFLTRSNQDNIVEQNVSGENEGILVPSRGNSIEQESIRDCGKSLVQTKEHNNRSSTSRAPYPSAIRRGELTSDTETLYEEMKPARENSNASKANTSDIMFTASKRTKVVSGNCDILVHHESSEDEDENIDWEDGNINTNSNSNCITNINSNSEDGRTTDDSMQGAVAIDTKDRKTCQPDGVAELPQNDEKNAIHGKNIDGDGRSKYRKEENLEDLERCSKKSRNFDAIVAVKERMPGDEALASQKKVEPTKANEKSCGGVGNGGVEQEGTVGNVIEIKCGDRIDRIVHNEASAIDTSLVKEATTLSAEVTIHCTDASNIKETDDKDDDDDDDEVDWEDGIDETVEYKSKLIDLCEEDDTKVALLKRELTSFDENDGKADAEDEEYKRSGGKQETVDLCKGRKAVNRTKRTDDVVDNGAKDVDRNDSNKGLLKRESKSEVQISTTRRLDGISTQKEHNSTVQVRVDESDRAHNASKYFDLQMNPSVKMKAITLDDDSDDDQIEWETGDMGGSSAVIDIDDWGKTKAQGSNDVAAALEHAQGTAANLTNWAGRAFRRAIAQHALENGMKIPDSAKPIVLKKNKQFDKDEDGPIVDKKPNTVVPPEQGASKGRLQSVKQGVPNGAMQNGDIDNSDWLDAVNSVNAYREECAVERHEPNPSDRLLDATIGGVTEEMRTEVMQLLRLFGIPYVVAPAEAEAQCVELEKLGLVDGIVTEDSDTFVFGGQVVYKNIFDDKKYVEVYHAKDASEEMNLTQDSLVALAMLLGGDYTEGVKGVGIVNGMEVLQAFDVAHDCKAGLKRFRKWLDGFDPNDVNNTMKGEENRDNEGVRSEKEKIFHRKHHTARTRWIAPKHFPDVKVLNAYLNPVVDTSRERFSWGIPDLDGLVAFCHRHMGWVGEETEKLIAPIIRRMEDGSMRQTRIDSFMRYEDGIKFAKIQSKRLRRVLGLSTKDEKVTLDSRNDDRGIDNGELRQPEFPFSESEGTFTAVDIANDQHELIDDANNSQSRPKRYNGKRTRSLAALSSASASTIAIASSSKGDVFENVSSDTTSVSINHNRANVAVPKKAPPRYQKQSSAILDEQEENATKLLDESKTNKYEVVNPSMI